MVATASCFLFDSLSSKLLEKAPSSSGLDSKNPVFSAFVNSSSPFSVRIIVKVQPSSPSQPTEMSASSELKSSHTLQLFLTNCFMSARGIAVVPAGVVTSIFPLMFIFVMSFRLMPSLPLIWVYISPS